MSHRQLLQQKFNNCFLDLQRAATSFYFKPQGKTHFIFLRHAQEILKGTKDKKAKTFFNKITQVKKRISQPPSLKKTITNLADEVLTLGLLLKRD